MSGWSSDAGSADLVPLVRYLSTGKRHPSSFALANPFSAYAETVRSIYTALRFSQIDRPPRILLVTSAISGEGKTAMALTLGRLIAMSGKKIGRAHVLTPVTNAQLVCRLLLEKKQNHKN